MRPNVVNCHLGGPPQVGQIFQEVFLSLLNRAQVLFVLALVFDERGDAKCRDGKPESPVRAWDGCENIEAFRLSRRAPGTVLVLDFL